MRKNSVTFDGLPNGSYFRLDTDGMDTIQAKDLRKFRCRKVYDNHYIQIQDHLGGLAEETLRRSYGDFKVIVEETKNGAVPNQDRSILPGSF